MRRRGYSRSLKGGFHLVTDPSLGQSGAELVTPISSITGPEFWTYLGSGLEAIVAAGGVPSEVTAIQNWFAVPHWAGEPEYVTRACELALDGGRDILRMGVNPRVRRQLFHAKQLPPPPIWGYGSVDEVRHAHRAFERRYRLRRPSAKRFLLNIEHVGATPDDFADSRIELRGNDTSFELGVIQAQTLHDDAFVARAPHYRRGDLPPVSSTPVELLDDLGPDDPRFVVETKRIRAYIDFLIPEPERAADRRMLVTLYATRPFRASNTKPRPTPRPVRNAPPLSDPLGRLPRSSRRPQL